MSCVVATAHAIILLGGLREAEKEEAPGPHSQR